MAVRSRLVRSLTDDSAHGHAGEEMGIQNGKRLDAFRTEALDIFDTAA